MTDSELKLKLQKLLIAAKDLHEKNGDILNEIDDLIGGGAGIGAKLRQVEDCWARIWQSRYKDNYVFQYAKDRPQIKRLLKTLTIPQLEARMLRFIKNNDPFYVGKRHTFSLFVAAVNAMAGDSPSDFGLTSEAPTVADCAHTPRCKSDQEHTKKRQAEMRV